MYKASRKRLCHYILAISRLQAAWIGQRKVQLVEDLAGVVVVSGQAADGLAGGGQAVQLHALEFAQRGAGALVAQLGAHHPMQQQGEKADQAVCPDAFRQAVMQWRQRDVLLEHAKAKFGRLRGNG